MSSNFLSLILIGYFLPGTKLRRRRLQEAANALGMNVVEGRSVLSPKCG